MTCAQGLLRLLWGGPEVGVLRDWRHEIAAITPMMTNRVIDNFHKRVNLCVNNHGKHLTDLIFKA